MEEVSQEVHVYFLLDYQRSKDLRENIQSFKYPTHKGWGFLATQPMTETAENIVPFISDDEFFSISRNLERHHAVFYKLWELGKPSFDDQIPTAQVEFDKDGSPIAFVFNPKFWNKLTPYEREFIICHECLHVILNHGLRCQDTKTGSLANIALDIVVNHLLVDRFGYDRKQLTMNKEICWIDTVFKGKKMLRVGEKFEIVDSKNAKAEKIPVEAPFEFYYLLLRQEAEKNQAFAALIKALETLDGHSSLAGQNVDDILDQLNDSLSNQEKDALKDVLKKHYDDDKKNPNKQAGQGVGRWTFISVGPVKRQHKWETVVKMVVKRVIKTWSRKLGKPEFRDVEQWARINRRFAMLNTKFFIPSEMEIEHDQEDKIDVWFMQDTSGSCYHMKERFFKAALSLSTERFNVRFFCFDTAVQEISLNSKKIYGGGGTSFSIIEAYIQKTIAKEKVRYPEAVFIITDGHGNFVKPAHPERWYWFLSTKCTHFIPKESPRFMLSDFE